MRFFGKYNIYVLVRIEKNSIQPNMAHFMFHFRVKGVSYSTEYVTRVQYSARDICGPTFLNLLDPQGLRKL
jgi:hypothetical protein